MPEDVTNYQAIIQENQALKEALAARDLELTELKAQLAELRRLIYGSTSESRRGGSNQTPAKKKRKKK